MKIEVKQGESVEQALRRFNRAVMEEGIVDEIKDRRFYTKPSMVKKLKKKEKKAKVARVARWNR